MSNVTSVTNLTDPTAYSKDKLVEMLQNARISRRSSVKGSLYTLGDDHTYTTLNERPGTYAGLPGAAMIDLGKNRLRSSNIDLVNGSDDDSVMSNVTSMTNLTDPTAYSKDELMEMLKMRVFHVDLP